MKRLAAVLALAVVAACGGAATETTSTTLGVSDRRRLIAADYAESAERALLDTRYEVLGPTGIQELVLDACDRLASSSPDAAVADALASLDVPAGEPVDEEIATEVVVEGLASVCPDDVLRASGIDPADAEAAGDTRALYLAAVAPFAADAGLDVSEETLVQGGGAVCASLQRGDAPEEAILAGFDTVFGIQADTLDEITAGSDEAAVVGGVLGAAAIYFCPTEAERVAVYLQQEGLG
ncbi:MAG: hypothetical protein R3290_00775 [Acidimicrobiia bacterium]|nr:hypothetical protein [Acidimicrobiia bacterium]